MLTSWYAHIVGSQERRQRHRSELRARILSAARELFASEGVDKVSMRRIAERIEYSPKTLYLHFKSKGDLLYHVVEESFGRLNEEMGRLLDAGGDPLELIGRALHCYVRFALDHPNDYRIAFLSPPSDYPYRVQEELPQGSVALEIHGRIRELLKRGMKSGAVRDCDPVVTTYVLWAGAHGVTLALIFDPEFRWVDRKLLIDETIGALVRSLRK